MRCHSVVGRSVFLFACGDLHVPPEQCSGLEEWG
jgi:hypothetical protein